ncbi:MAG: AI-2E family transporter [Candidatus Eisenbacteria bacterium]
MISTRENFARPFLTVLMAAAVVAMWAMRDVLMLVGFAALVAFAIEPLVVLIERIRTPRGALPRSVAAAMVMFLLVGVGVWALVVAVPQLVGELTRSVEDVPASLDRLLGTVRGYANEHGLTQFLGPLGGSHPMDAIAVLKSLGVSMLHGLSGQLANLTALVGLVLIPLLAFYLLSQRQDVAASVLGFLPEELHLRANLVWVAIERALRSYVRGQSVVCLTMGALVGLALMLIGVPVPALLGTVVGIAEIIPILGFWIASLAIVVTGWSVSPGLALAGFAAYLVINQVVGFFITPLVMGRHMKLHPFVVTVSILAGGTLLGAAGAVLALPLAAAVQSVVSEFAKRPPGGRGRV